MRMRDRERLIEARQRRHRPPDLEQTAGTGGLLRRLLGFWLFHKIFGGDS